MIKVSGISLSLSPSEVRERIGRRLLLTESPGFERSLSDHRLPGRGGQGELGQGSPQAWTEGSRLPATAIPAIRVQLVRKLGEEVAGPRVYLDPNRNRPRPEGAAAQYDARGIGCCPQGPREGLGRPRHPVPAPDLIDGCAATTPGSASERRGREVPCWDPRRGRPRRDRRRPR